MADIRALLCLALQVQFPILLSDFDQNDKGSTAVRGYYIPNLMAIRSTILDHYMPTDGQTERQNLTSVGPCIVIYFYSKTNQMHNLASSLTTCMTYTCRCMYSLRLLIMDGETLRNM
jgi:hypothetical protein